MDFWDELGNVVQAHLWVTAIRLRVFGMCVPPGGGALFERPPHLNAHPHLIARLDHSQLGKSEQLESRQGSEMVGVISGGEKNPRGQ